MNSREVFPDEELRRRIMDFIMAAGQTLLENGAEVFRVEPVSYTHLQGGVRRDHRKPGLDRVGH